MNPSRRGFLGALGFIAAAPAIVKVSSLMKLPPPKRVIMPEPLIGLGDEIIMHPNCRCIVTAIVDGSQYPSLAGKFDTETLGDLFLTEIHMKASNFEAPVTARFEGFTSSMRITTGDDIKSSTGATYRVTDVIYEQPRPEALMGIDGLHYI